MAISIESFFRARRSRPSVREERLDRNQPILCGRGEVDPVPIVDDLVLMPGLDGTGRLFAPLLEVLGGSPRVVVYPRGASSYDVLARAVELPRGALVVAESFSGPLAIRLARRHPDRVRALVLVASFVRGPRLLVALGPLLALAVARPPPHLAIRAAMVGLDAPTPLVRLVHDAIESVPPRTIAGRIRAAAAADVRADFAALELPILWLRASHDRLAPYRSTELARSLRPTLDVHTIEGPHLLAQARPREVARAILAARARWPGSPRSSRTL
jgi:pimeloyl-ACP methyl ester carboxylesterase